MAVSALVSTSARVSEPHRLNSHVHLSFVVGAEISNKDMSSRTGER